MKKIKVENLKPGMKFSAPVYLDGENLLVPEKVEIKEKDIERLKRWGITEVTTAGKPVTDSKQTDTGKNAEDADSIESKYTKVIHIFDDIFTKVKNKQPVSKSEIDQIISLLLTHLLNDHEKMLALAMRSGETENRLAQSSVNCMIMSGIIGQSLKIPSQKLVQIALGALLHDIGMNRIPPEILAKTGDLDPEERKTIIAHPVYSFHITTKEIGYPEEIGKIVLHHHERWDGKGYPKQLKGNEIPLGARIVSVADAFEAMVRDRPYRGSMIGYKAMREILNDNFRRYDANILKIFIKNVGIYPIGSIVVLNNGSIARVVKAHSQSPLRPLVEILIDEKGKQLDNKAAVDMINDKSVFIVRAINPNELKKVTTT